MISLMTLMAKDLGVALAALSALGIAYCLALLRILPRFFSCKLAESERRLIHATGARAFPAGFGLACFGFAGFGSHRGDPVSPSSGTMDPKASEPVAPGLAEAGVTLLKPLHGDEPLLYANLSRFMDQDYHGPIQWLFGVRHADDPAVKSVERLRAAYPEAMINLIVAPQPGDSEYAALESEAVAVAAGEGKIANLARMLPHARYPTLVLSDSDIVVAPDYLSRLVRALEEPGVGAVTCLYNGRGDAGFWSKLGAAGVSYQFLPGATLAVVLSVAQPCLGATIALRRETLERIGGFTPFANVLADDYHIGEAVRALGLKVVVPPMLVTHASRESNIGTLWRQELRWGVTVRALVPWSYRASVIAMPLPLALIAALLVPGNFAILSVAALALIARFAVARRVDEICGGFRLSPWLIPLRDCLSFAVFIASHFVHTVDWRGSVLTLNPRNRNGGLNIQEYSA